MKNITILSIIFSSLLTSIVKNDYIRIEYVGDADAAMGTVYISKEPIPRPELIMTIEYNSAPQNYIVDNDDFIFINKTVNSSLKKPFEERDYNGFKITLRQSNDTVAYFITRKNSNSLFLKVNAYLKGHKRNEDLISALNSLRLSNVFPR